MTRLNKTLAVLLAVQVVLAALVLASDRGAPPAQLTPVLPALDGNKVTRIQIFDRRDRDAPDDSKPAVDLTRTQGTWSLASHFGYPVDAGKVGKLMDDLAAMKAREPLSSSAARYPQLRVADQIYERKLVLTTDSGEQTVWLGQPAGGRRTAVRVRGDNRVLAVAGVTPWSIDASARGWVDPTYLRVDTAQLQTLEVRNAKGVTSLDRASGSWALRDNGVAVALAAGESIDTARIDAVIGKLGTLTLLEPADPSRDVQQPLATITLRVAPAAPAAGSAAPPATTSPAGIERVLDVLADGERYWVRERGNPRAVLVEKSTLQDVVDLNRAVLITKPTPPVPPAAVAPPSQLRSKPSPAVVLPPK